MARPLSPDAFLRALRYEGAHVQPYAGWRARNRGHSGAWGPVHGVMLHHTAGRDSVTACRDGRPDLSGPLCIALVAKDGTVHLVGFGRTNHAGFGSAGVLNAVRGRAPLPGPGTDVVDGDARFYGFAVENLGNGNDPYPEEQLAATARLAAAVCRAHGWPAGSVIGHKEWAGSRRDPSFSMTRMRDRVARLLDSPEWPAYAALSGDWPRLPRPA